MLAFKIKTLRGLFHSAKRAFAASTKLRHCGLPEHLSHARSPSLYELAWFANQAYKKESEWIKPVTEVIRGTMFQLIPSAALRKVFTYRLGCNRHVVEMSLLLRGAPLSTNWPLC